MLDIIFPENISINSEFKTQFETSLIKNKAGYEFKNSIREHPIKIFNISSAIKTKENMNYIIDLFHIVRGRKNSFLFKDWSDYEINNIIDNGNGVLKEFKIIKKYQILSEECVRNICHIKQETARVFIDETECYDYNISNGIIYFNNPPSLNSKIILQAEFYVPVRFNSDEISLKYESFSSGKIKEIELIEVF